MCKEKKSEEQSHSQLPLNVFMTTSKKVTVLYNEKFKTEKKEPEDYIWKTEKLSMFLDWRKN